MIELHREVVALLPRLRRYAAALARSNDAVDDLVQSACERALAAGRPAAGVPIDAWMLTIVRNLWFDRLRRQRTEGSVIDVDAAGESIGSDHAAGHAEARVELDRVRLAIDRLPDEQRDVLLLVCVEELSYKGAAAALDLPIGTVMSRLARARVRLAQMLGEAHGVSGRRAIGG